MFRPQTDPAALYLGRTMRHRDTGFVGVVKNHGDRNKVPDGDLMLLLEAQNGAHARAPRYQCDFVA